MIMVEGNAAWGHALEWPACTGYTLATMRTVTLLRHAKSSWAATPAGSAPPADKARPLAPRGLRDAPRMAAWMAAHGIRPELVLCSTAVRARQTLELVQDAVLAAEGTVTFRDELYLAEAEDLIEIVRNLAEGVHHVMLVGHDPGMHEAAQLLIGAGDIAMRRLLADKFPTAAAAVIDFKVRHWRDIAPGEGRLRLFMAPKRLPD